MESETPIDAKEKRRAYDRWHYAAHRQKIVASKRKYRAEHRDEFAEYKKQYDEEHQEEQKQYRIAHREKRKQYLESHRDAILLWQKQYCDAHREERRRYDKQYRLAHKDDTVRRMKKWHAAHKDDERQYRAAHREEEKQRQRQYVKVRRSMDVSFKLACSLRGRLRTALRAKGTYKTKSALKLVGCTLPELRLHIQSKWKSKMCWGNWGPRGWHIDHIRPCSSFDLSDPEQQRVCFHYTNLQPLWWYENFEKHTRWEEQQKGGAA